jgi:hypothetical protein
MFMLFAAYPFSVSLAQTQSPKEKAGLAPSVPVVMDSTDLFAEIKGDSVRKEVSVEESRGVNYMLLPIVSYKSGLGLNLGAGITGTFISGDPMTTKISSFAASANVTTQGQFLVTGKGTIVAPNNDYIFLSDLRFFLFSQSTYGLGSDYAQPVKEDFSVGGTSTETGLGEQPMNFNFIRTYLTMYRKVTGDLYAGFGYYLDYHYEIEDLKLNLDSTPQVVTSHYAYSTYYGYPTNAYISSGFGINALYDSRDHTMNPYLGTFAQASVRVYPRFLGSTAGYTSFYAEARKYVPLSESRPRHLLAFWMVSQFTVGGKPPYLDLPASGYDMYNSSARGYIQGRWRGTEWMSLETEWRIPITNNGLLGAVVFANATTTSRPEIGSDEFGIHKPALPLFGAMRYAVGGGLRIMLMRASRMNLSIDYARGENGSSGVYIYAGEAF